MAIRVACTTPLLLVFHILAIGIFSYNQGEWLAPTVHGFLSLCDPNGVERSL